MTEEEKIDLLAANIVVLLPREVSLSSKIEESTWISNIEKLTWIKKIIKYDNYNYFENMTLENNNSENIAFAYNTFRTDDD